MSCAALFLAATLVSASGAAELVDVTTLDNRFRLDIRYATADNFTHQQLYPVARCLLRPEVAEQVKRAQAYLDVHYRGYVLMFKDCYRPVSVQRRLWALVRGTPAAAYVANPNSKTGSVHNYGAAVDLTLMDEHGQEVDMGTAYDFLGELSEPQKEEAFLRDGKLTPEHLQHRRMLRDAMTKGGNFIQLANEWWHFDALRGAALRAKYQPLDLPLTP